MPECESGGSVVRSGTSQARAAHTRYILSKAARPRPYRLVGWCSTTSTTRILEFQTCVVGTVPLPAYHYQTIVGPLHETRIKVLKVRYLWTTVILRAFASPAPPRRLRPPSRRAAFAPRRLRASASVRGFARLRGLRRLRAFVSLRQPSRTFARLRQPSSTPKADEDAKYHGRP